MHDTAGQAASAPALVSTQWLAEQLRGGGRRVVALDASWRFEAPDLLGIGDDSWIGRLLGRNSPKLKKPTVSDDFAQRRIRGARFSGLDKFSSELSTMPNMVTENSEFFKALGQLGVSPDDHVVVYDSVGMHSAPRAWWVFKYFGHDRVSVLDGGLPKWIREGLPIDEGSKTEPYATTYPAREPRKDMVIGLRELGLSISDFSSAEPLFILDARPVNRFSGWGPEPREQVKSGHIPSSINIPHTMLLSSDGTLMPPPELAELFISRIPDFRRRDIVTMSGSGVTAALLNLALEQAGHMGRRRLFDGSWTQWALHPKGPISTWGA
nr:hypothetical protein HK105_003841 [Polyrhizophydium stewartii]